MPDAHTRKMQQFDDELAALARRAAAREARFKEADRKYRAYLQQKDAK